MAGLSLSLYAGVERALGRSVTWRLGRWLYLGSRRELINDPRLNGEYALQGWLLDAAARSANAQGLVFIDVGANLGDWSDHLARAAAKRGLEPRAIHVFEPAPAQRAALTARLASGPLEARIEVDPRGIGDRSCRARLQLDGDKAGSNALTEGRYGERFTERTVEIELATLDQACAERGYDSIFLVKVDTEGNDFNVIRGARGLFEAEAIRVMQFEYNWRWIEFGHVLRDVFHRFCDTNYAIGKLTSGGVELYSDWHPELDRFTETNYLILHRDVLDWAPHWHGRFDRFNALPQIAPEPRPAMASVPARQAERAPSP